MKKILLTILTAVFIFVNASAAYTQDKKIGMKRAQAIATEHARGLKLKGKELEHENGQWIYSFEFRNNDGSTREVNVNAYTGKVVGIEHETPSKERKERKDEMNRSQ